MHCFDKKHPPCPHHHHHVNKSQLGVFYVASLLNWRKKYQYALIFHVIFPAHSFCIFPALFSAREPFLPLIAALPSAEERLWEAFSETCLNFYQFPQCSVKNCQEINVYQSIQQKKPTKRWFFIRNIVLSLKWIWDKQWQIVQIKR